MQHRSTEFLETIRSQHLYFRSLLLRDSTIRQKAVQDIMTELHEVMNLSGGVRTATSPRSVNYIKLCLPTIKRLAETAPFQDIRQPFTQLFDEIKLKHPQLVQEQWLEPQQISAFTSNLELIASDNPQVYELLQDSFLRTGRISHIVRVLAWHPSYLKSFRQNIAFTMTNDGPLPLNWRNYIALMAATQMSCPYVVAMQQHHFLINGGDAAWLAGLSSAPPKLADLVELNSLLAHRPWHVTKELVSTLLYSTNTPWSATELVHAIVIMCTYHALSSLVLGVGCLPELDLPLLTTEEDGFTSWLQFNQVEERDEVEQDGPEVQENAQVLQRLVQSSVDIDTCVTQHTDEDSYEEPFETAGVISLTPTSRNNTCKPLESYMGPEALEYYDFDVKSESYSVLHTEDFSWEEHGFSLVNRYLPGTAQLIDEQFRLILKLTYGSYGTLRQQVDTTPFRRAIWYYVHRLFGVCHDDYRYHEVNVFVGRSVKSFIKKTVCFPWRITQRDYEHCGVGHRERNNHRAEDETQTTRGPDRSLEEADPVAFSPDEKCHVVLLATEARKQAGLMYGLRAVMEHMN